MILGFFGDNRYLSNFYISPFEINGVTYLTNEHFYQASKAENLADHDYVVSSDTAGVAKARGRRITLRKDWNKVRMRVMRLGLIAKFNQNPELKEKLLATGAEYLEETNHWGDKFWGKSNGQGTNHLGEILMELRDTFRMEKFYVEGKPPRNAKGQFGKYHCTRGHDLCSTMYPDKDCPTCEIR